MRRAYVDVSHFLSPFDSPTLSLSGLGSAEVWSNWPAGRRYVDVAHFRAPYDQGYFQNNQLFGLGQGAPVPAASAAPADASLGPTLALIGVGAIVGAAGAYILMRGRKSSA